MKVISKKHEPISAEEVSTHFGALNVGDVFKHNGRMLVKIKPVWRIIGASYEYDPRDPDNENRPPFSFERVNAVRLHSYHDKEGHTSVFNDGTQVTKYPEAVLYLHG